MLDSLVQVAGCLHSRVLVCIEILAKQTSTSTYLLRSPAADLCGTMQLDDHTFGSIFSRGVVPNHGHAAVLPVVVECPVTRLHAPCMSCCMHVRRSRAQVSATQAMGGSSAAMDED